MRMRNTHFIQHMQVQDGRQALVYGRLGWVCKLALVCDTLALVCDIQVLVHTQVQVWGRLVWERILEQVDDRQEQEHGMQEVGRVQGEEHEQHDEECGQQCHDQVQGDHD